LGDAGGGVPDGTGGEPYTTRKCERWGTACSRLFPVRVDFTGSRLIIGECRAVIGRRCSSVDDVGGVTVEGGGWRVEGVLEVVGLARLAAGERWSFEGGGKGGEGAVVIEGAKKAGSYRGDLARIEASAWEAGQGASMVEGVEESFSYCRDLACVEASVW